MANNLDLLSLTHDSYLTRPLSQAVQSSGASFFFTNYACDDAPGIRGYRLWLTNAYQTEAPNEGIRAAIEAVGLAGISNISYAPAVFFESQRRYGRALAAAKSALVDPGQVGTDTTLMIVILLQLYEVCSVFWLSVSNMGGRLTFPPSLLPLTIGDTVTPGPRIFGGLQHYCIFEAGSHSIATSRKN